MIYHINPKRTKKNTAGAKAPQDITTLCMRRGYTPLNFAQFPKGKSKVYQHIWVQIVGNADWYKVYKKVSSGDVVIFQHPFYGKRTTLKWIKRIRNKGGKTIAIIHDLESLRGGIAGLIETNKTTEVGDNALLKSFDRIICHNEHMRQYMISQGFDSVKIINLEIFDYLSDCNPLELTKRDRPSISIAGNLIQGKCGYIYKICNGGNNQHLIINLFGVGFEQSNATKNMVYHGSFVPEELPKHLEGDFGLVWDGLEAYTCAGNTGEYLKYNNPHKTSLYLTAGIPVIVWSQAAIADYILKHEVGITVDSLYELEDRINEVTEEDYQKMCKNAKSISEKLRNGYYFYKALDECL